MKRLEALASHDPKDLAGMARFGINVNKAWVISIPKLRQLAKEIKTVILSETKDLDSSAMPQNDKKIAASQVSQNDKKRHQLAQELWETEVHEARILAGFVDVPELVTEKQMEQWVLGFDSWDVCDMICGNLFDRTPLAWAKAVEWSKREEEFVKRAGFVLMAGLAVHDRKANDEQFYPFFEIIKREATDERNFVRKAINWALRQIGKSRNANLYERALNTAQEIIVENPGSKAAQWIARDTIRELNAEYIKKRFK